MKRAVLVICDGHRSDFIDANLAPTMAALSDRGLRCRRHGSIFPSVTRAASAAIATGCQPRRNGIHGNRMALANEGHLTILDFDAFDFRDRLRRLRGRTLLSPTLAERVATHGGPLVYSNVSAAAACLQDPEGFGHVYHRDGSWGPGLHPISGLEGDVTSKDLEADRRITERFCTDALSERRPAIAILWLANPDVAMHGTPLGSPQHLAAVQAIDACVAMVVSSVDRQRSRGDDILLMVGSDHGHETVRQVVQLDSLLVDAGLKHSLESTDVVVVPQDLSCLIYMRDPARLDPIHAFLRAQPWFGGAFVDNDLAAIGLGNGILKLALITRHTPEPNAFGVPGSSVRIASYGDGEGNLGNGSHGGLGPNEQSPFLIVDGSEPAGGRPITAQTSLLDIAPTILKHLGLPWDGMDGRPIPLR